MINRMMNAIPIPTVVKVRCSNCHLKPQSQRILGLLLLRFTDVLSLRQSKAAHINICKTLACDKNKDHRHVHESE